VTPASAPLAARSERLVRAVRAAGAPGPVLVGGETAQLVDLRAALARRWPLALVLLLVATLGPLAFATRSAWLPVKTFAMNALTLAAAFGVLVVVFQHGRLEGLLDYTSSGALEAATMTVVAAIGFALATDYGVFLLTRIKEFHDRGMPQAEAVARGLQRTGPIITQAALLLCIALLSLLFARHALVKQVGLGTAVAVALDASLVRAFLVPSLMALFGPAWNWWWPRRSRR
jgi:putative drug exporter of the RND superfamily